MNHPQRISRKTIIIFLALPLALALAPFTWDLASEASGHKRRIQHKVVMISIDGLRPDFYLHSGFDTPALKKLKQTGAYAEGVTAVFPTVTYPNHVSLVTGVNPNIHGVLSNTLFSWGEGPLGP